MSTSNNVASRIEYLDLAKGICMIMVVLFHFEIATKNTLIVDNFMQIMFMPLFFVISGMFFKSESSFAIFLKKKLNQLLIPFFFFYLTTSILLPYLMQVFFAYDIQNPITVSSLWAFVTKEMFTNSPIWFLWCLFIINLLFYGLVKLSLAIPSCSSLLLGLCSVLCGILGYCLFLGGVNLPAYTDSAFTALPFFYIGFFLKNNTSILSPNKYDRYSWIVALILFVITFLCAYGSASYIHNRYSVDALTLYIIGFTGVMSVVFVSKTFNHIPLISYIGRNSLIVLCFHQPLIKIFIGLVKKFGVSGLTLMFVSMALLLLCIVAIIPLARKLLPHVTGQKKVIK